MSDFFGRDDVVQQAAQDAGPCLVIRPYLKTQTANRNPQAQLDEAIGLAHAIDLRVIHAENVALSKLLPGTLLGKGSIERIGKIEETLEEDCDLIIVDAALTPVQQRNLERAWKKKVIDRTGLILEIFGARARTREGRLQVDLASMNYQLGRLVRSWTHLERQRGGAGFMGGPGESQIELDRRLIRQRIGRLKRELAEVKRTRSLQRKARQRVPYPVVALVGYTNAGKSTLFNMLTGAEVEAKDQLFATLDPTMRRLELPGGQVVILSDTVGFVSDLPHDLVNAFHATLEEVIEADVVLHVRDISHVDTDAQKEDVLTVLKSLGIDTEGANDNRIMEVLNKIDRMAPEEVAVLQNRAERQNLPMFLVSAQTGAGTDALLSAISERTAADFRDLTVLVPYSDGKLLSWIYDRGDVLDRTDGPDGISMTVKLAVADAERLDQQRNKG